MKELNLDMGSVIVEGRVFAVDHKELKKRNAQQQQEQTEMQAQYDKLQKQNAQQSELQAEFGNKLKDE